MILAQEILGHTIVANSLKGAQLYSEVSKHMSQTFNDRDNIFLRIYNLTFTEDGKFGVGGERDSPTGLRYEGIRVDGYDEKPVHKLVLEYEKGYREVFSQFFFLKSKEIFEHLSEARKLILENFQKGAPQTAEEVMNTQQLSPMEMLALGKKFTGT